MQISVVQHLTPGCLTEKDYLSFSVSWSLSVPGPLTLALSWYLS